MASSCLRMITNTVEYQSRHWNLMHWSEETLSDWIKIDILTCMMIMMISLI
jgi:hypothetical protein